MSDRETIRIKYHSDEIEKLTYIEGKSDWIDLRVSSDYVLKKGDFKLIDMGVSMQFLHLRTLASSRQMQWV